MFTIGADPEVFIRDNETGGVVPVCGWLGGTKAEPVPLPDLGDGYAVQEDNVMAEFNIPPVSTATEFTSSIGVALEHVENLIRIRMPHCSLDRSSRRVFSAEHLSHPQAQQFGCAPDFDAYRNGAIIRPINPASLLREDGSGWRFAGGHVHMGGIPDNVPLPVVAQLCDVYLGLPSVALDQQGERRKRYGTPGRFRPTEWGMEYRTLSNFWIFSEDLRYNIGSRALSLLHALANDHDRVHAMYQEIPWAEVRSAILRENAALAADLLAYIETDLGGQLYE